MEIKCPCCGAFLRIDAALGRVVGHEPATKHAKARDLSQATRLLEKERARREAIFLKSAENEKSKAAFLQRKFEEALKESQDKPIIPPTRDIDLD